MVPIFMTEKRRNFKIVIEDATLEQNVFLISAPNRNAAIAQLGWLFNRMGVTVTGSVNRRPRSRRFSLLRNRANASKAKSTKASTKASTKNAARSSIYSLLPDHLATWETPIKYRRKRAIAMRVVDLYHNKKLDKAPKGN